MISKGQRLKGQPVIVQGNIVTNLNRISLFEKKFSEDWIQQLLQNHPEILPVDEIDGSFSPLIPIGREVTTNVGEIDNLFISSEGYLTIVETKLWRNPEARREVVAQILDYAKEVNKWTYKDLDNVVKAYNYKYHFNNDGLIATFKQNLLLEEEDEYYFIDRVSKILATGRFLLLIVGDGIRESVEEIVDFLGQNPNLLFTLSLVELQMFSLDKNENSLLILPQIITRTREIIRSIVKVESNKSENVKVTVDIENKAQTKSNSKRFTISEEDYFEQLLKFTHDNSQVELAKLIINDCETRGYTINWKQGSFVVKLQDPQGSDQKLTLFVVKKRGNIKIGWLQSQLGRINLPIEYSHTFAKNTASLFKNVEVDVENKDAWTNEPTLKELNPVYDKFMEYLDNFVKDVRDHSKNSNFFSGS